MQYTDGNLMQVIEELFQKMRQQNAGGEDRRTPYMQRNGTPDGRIGFPDGRTPLTTEIDRESGQRPPMARERVLRLIGMDEPISQNKLAEFLSIRPQSISELIVKLEKDGYIIRTKNEQDRRETLVSLTEMGKERSRDVESAREAQLSEFLMPLTTSEREQLFSLINKLLLKDNNTI